jgi:nitrite reductase/ring-hydroxylating ferredoxin subunit
MNDKLPDLELGVAAADSDQRPRLVGRVGTEQVLVVKSGNEYFAVAALCTHYHGHLVDGLLVDGTIRCPWHHACFDLKTGAVKRGPALDPLDRWQVDQQDGRIFVRRQLPRAGNAPYSADMQPESVVIVGTGAAGIAAALTLRRAGYQHRLTMVGGEPDAPYDRPNLSKDYLAGTRPEVAAAAFRRVLSRQRLQARARLRPQARRKAKKFDVARRPRAAFDRLLPCYGRSAGSPADCRRRTGCMCYRDVLFRAIIARAAAHAKGVVILGSSFIALEVARRCARAVVRRRSRLCLVRRVLGDEWARCAQCMNRRHRVPSWQDHCAHRSGR